MIATLVHHVRVNLTSINWTHNYYLLFLKRKRWFPVDCPTKRKNMNDTANSKWFNKLNLEPHFAQSIHVPSITIIIHIHFAWLISLRIYKRQTQIQSKQKIRIPPFFPQLAAGCTHGKSWIQCMYVIHKITIHAAFWWNIQINFSTIRHVSTVDFNHVWNHFKMKPHTPSTWCTHVIIQH